MLNVDGGVDIDAGGQNFFYILVTFGVTRSGCIGMRQFIHQHQLRVAGDYCVDIHLG